MAGGHTKTTTARYIEAGYRKTATTRYIATDGWWGAKKSIQKRRIAGRVVRVSTDTKLAVTQKNGRPHDTLQLKTTS